MIQETTGARLSRRAILALGTGTALAAVTATAGTAHASAPGEDAVCRRLAELEREYDARLGVFAHNVRTGRTVRYQADQTFPMCSVFKTLAAAAVLRDLDRDGEFLAKRVRYTQKDVDDAVWAPETGKHVADGMTVAELCDATITQSDNAAANLLLRELGGPTAVTRFCRSIGDPRTRLDRWEPKLNSAEPWRVEDTTSPEAIGRTYARLVLGNALSPRDRERLTGWLRANTTSTNRFRKGLPADWTLGDKTGAGDYGTNNDVGIAWTPDGSPVVLAVLTTKRTQKAKANDALIADTAGLLAKTLG
ncbi:class A beta-lactamase [Streptomyces sp. NPDC053048]|uniref:class A beta-lactamase n=1 Tax=Streptomyces sp. NPDC053048 TaxID=3365694 RepID=UPI0037D27B56